MRIISGRNCFPGACISACAMMLGQQVAAQIIFAALLVWSLTGIQDARAALVAGYAESLCETVTPQACEPRSAHKPKPPSMITPLTGVFTDQPRFEWRRATNASLYLLSVVEFNAQGAIVATFSRNITPQIECTAEVCAVTSTSLGYRLQPDAAAFKYRLIVSNDSGSSATPRTTVQIQ